MTDITSELQVDEYGRILNDPTHDESPSHGNSPAAWGLVICVLVGLVVAGISALASVWVVMWIGIILAIAGLPVGFFMRLAGKGANGEFKAHDFYDHHTVLGDIIAGVIGTNVLRRQRRYRICNNSLLKRHRRALMLASRWTRCQAHHAK